MIKSASHKICRLAKAMIYRPAPSFLTSSIRRRRRLRLRATIGRGPAGAAFSSSFWPRRSLSLPPHPPTYLPAACEQNNARQQWNLRPATLETESSRCFHYPEAACSPATSSLARPNGEPNEWLIVGLTKQPALQINPLCLREYVPFKRSRNTLSG